VEKSNILFVFKVDMFRFLNEFVVETYKEAKAAVETELNKKLEDNNMSLPEQIDKNTFADVVNLWD